MNYINYFTHVLFSPFGDLHRRYDFDLEGMQKQAQRIALLGLPFIGMYGSAGSFFSLSMGSCRAVSHLFQAKEAKKTKEITKELLEASLATLSIAGSYFNFTLGLYITNASDSAKGLFHTFGKIQEKKYREATEEAIQTLSSCLYLIFMTTGALEALFLFSLAQAILYLFQAYQLSQEEGDKQLEIGAKLLLFIMKLNQAHVYRKAIQRRDELLLVKKYQDLMQRALRGKMARHLIQSPLQDLPKNIEEKRVLLENQKGEYDFGSHFHGYGGEAVKNANIALKKDGEQYVELQFKLNHIFRDQLEKSINFGKMRREEIKAILEYSGSHATGISSKIIDENGYKKWQITLEGLGSALIGSSRDQPNAFDQVSIKMKANKTLYDLHEMLAFLNLDTALCLSSEENMDRLKIGHLFRTFFPREATPLERTVEFFSLPLEKLKEKIILQCPEMEKIFTEHLEKMKPVEILPGRIRYSIEGLAEKAKALGARCLISTVTSSDWFISQESLYERVASILQMGLISEEMRKRYQFDDYPGYSATHAWTGGDDSVFVQLLTQQNIRKETELDDLPYKGPARIIVSLEALEKVGPTYQFCDDSLGNRLVDKPWWIGWLEDYSSRSNIFEFIQKIQSEKAFAYGDWDYDSHEIMIKERISPKLIQGIVLDTEGTKRGLLTHLRKLDLFEEDSSGKETFLGKDLDNFFKVGNKVSEELLAF